MMVEVCSSGWRNHTITAALIVWRSRVSPAWCGGALALTEPPAPARPRLREPEFPHVRLEPHYCRHRPLGTVYLDRAVRQLRAQGATVPDDLLAHVAPLGREHIALTGDYVWTEANPAAPFRPLREIRATFPPLAA